MSGLRQFSGIVSEINRMAKELAEQAPPAAVHPVDQRLLLSIGFDESIEALRDAFTAIPSQTRIDIIGSSGNAYIKESLLLLENKGLELMRKETHVPAPRRFFNGGILGSERAYRREGQTYVRLPDPKQAADSVVSLPTIAALEDLIDGLLHKGLDSMANALAETTQSLCNHIHRELELARTKNHRSSSPNHMMTPGPNNQPGAVH